MGTNELIIRDREEGDRRWFLGGGVHLWKLSAEETGGDFFLLEDLLVRGKSTPLHRHPHASETLYLLEGSILVHDAGKERELGAGGVVMVPRGVPHAFVVTSERARLLCFQTPGLGQAFYHAASAPTTTDTGPVDFARLGELARQHPSLEILGPPPFAR